MLISLIPFKSFTFLGILKEVYFSILFKCFFVVPLQTKFEMERRGHSVGLLEMKLHTSN